MKQILIILGLFTTVTTFAQSPRIKLNQITKDTVKGSVLISSPSDSGMVYSRDFYIAYGADTVLILYGDTLAATSGIISSVLSDGVTITGDGTTGNELKVDTSTVISTIQGLVDSLANYVTTNTTQTISGAKTFTANTVFDDSTLVVDATNNRVGIGTTSPDANVQINAPITSVSANQFLIKDGSNDGFFSISESVSGSSVYVPTFYGISSGIDDYGMVFSGGPVSTRDSGLVGRAAIIFQALEYDVATNTYSALENTHLFNFTNYGTSVMFIQNNGNVGFGTTSPSHPLEMASGAHVTSGGTWTNASDIKLKENINYYYPYGLNEILNLKPTVFDYINGEKNSLGFIAQDVFEIIPEAISSTIDENGNETMGIKMVSITATLVKALQEQQTEINQLKTLITDLTNRLTILENK